MGIKNLTLVFLLSLVVGCGAVRSNPDMSVEGRLTRIGLGVDATINQVADLAQSIHKANPERFPKEQFNKVIQHGITVTDFVDAEVIPALRALDKVPDDQNKQKALAAVNQLIARLPPLYETDNQDTRAELYAKVFTAYQLTLELIEEIK